MKRALFKIVMSGLAIAALPSCQKDCVNISDQVLENGFNPAEEFSLILSSAVADDASLREFIKAEALSQFDKDFDVFYPWVKDKIVENCQTFRDILLKHDKKNILSTIEQEMPLLNILVPDWSWIGAFSINSWDTSDNDIVVTYASETNNHPLFHKGAYLEDLDSRLFPEYPVLVVKNNERMKIASQTKSGDFIYEFADENYRPEPLTRVKAETTYEYPTVSLGSNYVDLSSFSANYPEAISGWNEYGLDPYGAQRNYIYYSIPKGKSDGLAQNPKIRESVIAIRLHNTNWMESEESKDPQLNKFTKKDSPYSDTDDIVNAIWSDGQLEIQLYATTIENGEVKVLNSNAIPVSGKEIFDISKIQRDFYHKTAFSKRKYVYIPDQDNLLAKWYYLPTPLKFEVWEPGKYSSIINIHAYEMDTSIQKNVTDTIKEQTGISVSAKEGDKFSFNLNFGASENSRQYTYTIYQGNDDLGEIRLHFNDYVIRSVTENQCELNYYSTAQLDFIIVPTK